MSRISGLVACILSVASLALSQPARADGCRRVHAEINLDTGTIEGNLGLDGTVAFVRDSVGTAPATAPANSSVFSGILTVSTETRGVLSIRETGMFSSRIGNALGPCWPRGATSSAAPQASRAPPATCRSSAAWARTTSSSSR